nr:uncharacterized protein LOC127299425 isoform X3 [Lolium perenne]
MHHLMACRARCLGSNQITVGRIVAETVLGYTTWSKITKANFIMRCQVRRRLRFNRQGNKVRRRLRFNRQGNKIIMRIKI